MLRTLGTKGTGLTTNLTRRTMATLKSHNVRALKDKSLFKETAFINGQWVSANDNSTFEVHDPATGDLIGHCPELSLTETRQAIDAATNAFPSFSRMPPRQRAKILRKWYDLMNENAEDLATLITWENGKPLADASGEVTYAANFLEWFSEEAPRTYGDTIPASAGANRIFTLKQPVGVCGLITPWNFPAAMLTRKIGPALAAGCTVVAKAPSETPYTALALAELSKRAGVPDGVINILTGHSNTAKIGKELCENEKVKKISFTGSTPVGRILMSQASGTLKKLSFELGGNAPLIVFEDADIDTAIAGTIASKFRSSGQTCVCANRIFVHKSIYDTFVEKLTAKVSEFKLGSGFEKGVTHGPLIHAKAIDKVDAHVQDAKKKGAKVTIGGSRSELGEHFYQPTVIRDMKPDMDLHSEETFGPIAGIFAFETEKEVVALANSAEVGLAAYFYSKDLARIWRVAEALEVGMVGVNTGLISDVVSPFGGVKQSGFGREGSKYGIEEYQTIKSVTIGGVGELQG